MKSLLTIYSLWGREMVRFYRQPSRIVGALGSPVIFWLLIGSGIGTSFQGQTSGPKVSYLEYFFPGTLLLILLFTAIFSTISIIEDRREGFLQAVLAAPVSRTSIALGKIMGGATLAFSQGFLFLLATPFLGIHLTGSEWLTVCLVMFLSAFTLTGLGFVMAWHLNSTQGFHALMNIFMIPLWLLSGALFPTEGASGWIRIFMKANPLSYELALLRRALYPAHAWGIRFPSVSFSLAVTIGFGLALLFLSYLAVSRRSARNVI